MKIKSNIKSCICIIFHTVAGSKITEKYTAHLEVNIKLLYIAQGLSLISNNLWFGVLIILSVLILQYI